MSVSDVAGCAAGESTDMRAARASYQTKGIVAVHDTIKLPVNGFHRSGTTLLCEDVRLEELASAEGTPLYVYSAGTIASRPHESSSPRRLAARRLGHGLIVPALQRPGRAATFK